ncbi:phosphatase PAP2 family protein [Paraburkholderia sp.]|jgi:membrane-associated phospholipid phosphatase|uniref:phosphatase PAP2 family protein n=1 Tax=Paraburkholderia sp. TaxID=1926495 RepID=UPI002F4233FA
MWPAISDLGDAALTLPLAIVCCAWLSVSLSGWRAALVWLTPLAAGMLMVGVTKILYAGCGVQFPSIGFRVISGHTMLASAVWPMAFLIALRSGSDSAASSGTRIALMIGLGLAALIGTARVFDKAHTLSEVIAGWTLGMVVTLLFVSWKETPLLSSRLRPYAIASLVAVSAAAYGHHAPIQDAIDNYSPFLCQRFL